MKYASKKLIRPLLLAALTSVATGVCAQAPAWYRMKPQWSVGVDASAAYVPSTNSFLSGENASAKDINTTFAGALRGSFRFNPSSREGMLYKGLYQGLAFETRSFAANSLLGTPVSLYAFQGAPFLSFGNRLSLGYEWKFGAAFGWKHYDHDTAPDNGAVSTSVTAYMGLGLRLAYELDKRWTLAASVDVTHFSNGNTSLPNAGVNAIGAAIGVAYNITPTTQPDKPSPELIAEADRGRWFYDIMLYGAWRKRAIDVGAGSQLCPGKFGVAGLQFAPMRKINRYFAAGAALDVKYDESTGLAPYWVEGTYDDDIHFYRPPFGKQMSLGISAHAELTMPIFAVNVGLGYDIISPEGEKRFYQMLTLKTFIHEKIYINTGYRLGNFKDPQNLMLGIGLRL